MDADILWTILCALAILVGVTGVIIPVLPGSLLVAAGVLTWAIVVGAPVGWIVFGIAAVLVAVGMLASSILTGKAMKRRAIPGRSVVIGVLVGVVGFFVVPVVGLLLGFAVGLFLSEWLRQKALGPATSSSLAALKAIGLGMVVEFGCVALAAGTWATGVLVYFNQR